MVQLEYGNKKGVIPLYAKTGQELHPIFSEQCFRIVYAAVRQAVRKGRAPLKRQMELLSQFVSGEWLDHNGHMCPVPKSVRAKTVRMLARVRAHLPIEGNSRD